MRIGYGTSITVPASTELWLSLLRSGQVFSGLCASPAVAAQYSFSQLFNPNASGKEILLRLVMASAGAAMPLAVDLYNVALATLDGNGSNLLSGSPVSVAELRHGSNAANLGTEVGLFRLAANDSKQLGGDWIIELPPNKGLVIGGGVVNTQIEVWFMWAEL